jgi:hypothetical protein
VVDEERIFAPDAAPPAFQVVVNFGVVVGRQATEDELVRLGESLREETTGLTVVSEQRLEFGREGQAAVHQVRVEVDEQAAASISSSLYDRVIAVAAQWVRDCRSQPGGRTLAERYARDAVVDDRTRP